MALDVFAQGRGGGFIVALRSFRLARIVRLVKSAPALREIFGTLYFTAVGLLNVFGLLFLLLFVYSVMGMQLFACVHRSIAAPQQATVERCWQAAHALCDHLPHFLPCFWTAYRQRASLTLN